MWETLPFGLQRTKHTPSRTKFYQIQFCLNYTSFSQGSIFFHSSLFNGINQLLLQDFAAAFFKSLLMLTEIKITHQSIFTRAIILIPTTARISLYH